MTSCWGQGGADRLNGGPGADQLHGGTGNDRLTGGNDADRFYFHTAPNAKTNHDIVTDFTSGSDTLVFSQNDFIAIGALGKLTASAFWSGAGVTSAHDASDRVIYDSTTGALYYDADGSGGVAAAVLVAHLGVSVHPALAAGDLLIVV
ncbi:MAG: hypothetical protein ACKVOL_02485 [Novosphingobium sp.]